MYVVIYVYNDYNLGNWGFCIPHVWVFVSKLQPSKMLLYHCLQFYNIAISLVYNFDID